MPRFFVRQDRISNGFISIIGEDAHHIARSLRMAAGEEITVCDMQGNEYNCKISSFDEDREVIAEILSQQKSENEPTLFITLYQALPKGDKFDTIIQKAVECGVSRIVPFQSERCVVKIKGDSEEKKKERRQRISAEAAKQCGRSVIPEVCNSITYKDALEEAKNNDLILFCYEGDGTISLGKILKDFFNNNANVAKSVAIFIGSEGGFSIKEADMAKNNGAIMTGLGKRILRTETASGFVLSCLVCFSEL
ncbi:MAG: 16S rRNA (uracil(1498)-N(3))-methyltransferase [Ruminococcaceae bacterium]|nr:16S rRNA (uracil(1498)-N(3))-methyltransferase [Oscillospiraceae bacterium]